MKGRVVEEALLASSVVEAVATYTSRRVESLPSLYDHVDADATVVVEAPDGPATARTVAIAERGIRNLLIHAGILEGELELRPSRRLTMPDSCFVCAVDDGMLEPCVDLGEPVRAGQEVARVHHTRRTGLAPVAYRATLDGILAARHFPGLVKPGDCMAVVAQLQEA